MALQNFQENIADTVLFKGKCTVLKKSRHHGYFPLQLFYIRSTNSCMWLFSNTRIPPPHHLNQIWILPCKLTEAATRGVLCKEVFLKTLQNSQENTCARFSFLIKAGKKETLVQVFSCEICEISKNTFFTKHLWMTSSRQIELVYEHEIIETCIGRCVVQSALALFYVQLTIHNTSFKAK